MALISQTLPVQLIAEDEVPIGAYTEVTEITEVKEVVEPQTPEPTSPEPVYTSNPTDIYAKVDYYANLYGVDPWLMHHIVDAESSYNQYAVGDKTYYKPSYGLAQINLYWNPHVTEAMAYDPDYALDFLASNLSQGRCYLWSTCPF